MNDAKALAGSCYCGAVRLEMSKRPGSVTECNCSICRRYGARWAYFTRSTASARWSDDAVRHYSWGDHEIEFCFCRHCGCLTHYESPVKTPDSRLAINARMMEPGDVEGIPVRYFDGADSWTYIDK